MKFIAVFFAVVTIFAAVVDVEAIVIRKLCPFCCPTATKKCPPRPPNCIGRIGIVCPKIPATPVTTAAPVVCPTCSCLPPPPGCIPSKSKMRCMIKCQPVQPITTAAPRPSCGCSCDPPPNCIRNPLIRCGNVCPQKPMLP